MPGIKNEKNYREAEVILASYLVFLWGFLKDSGFAAEEEVRMVIMEGADLVFPDRHYVIPAEPKVMDRPFVGAVDRYTSLKFNLNSIKTITIGPRNNKKAAEIGIRRLLTDYGYDADQIEIRLSKIPYR